MKFDIGGIVSNIISTVAPQLTPVLLPRCHFTWLGNGEKGVAGVVRQYKQTMRSFRLAGLVLDPFDKRDLDLLCFLRSTLSTEPRQVNTCN